jgi:hypothetical protein
LFLFIDVKVKLKDGCAFFDQHLFESHDLIVAPVPNFFGHQGMHPDYKHIFVMTAVEDDDFPSTGDTLMDPP